MNQSAPSQATLQGQSACPAEAGISLAALLPAGSPAWWGRVAPWLDRALGIRALDGLYRRHGLCGLPPFEFAERTLRALNISLLPIEKSIPLPESGPVLVVCNHPFGGVEALALMKLLAPTRTDIRFLANAGLRVIRELRPLFIATNPLRVTQHNLSSIRQCEAHLAGGGLLVVFPAGKVSYPAGGGRVADAPWHRLAGHLARRAGATLLPVFFHGCNSPLFHRLGAVCNRIRLFMLPREFLRLRGRAIRFEAGPPVAAEALRHMDAEALTQYARAMTYLLDAHPVTAAAREAPPDAALAALNGPARVAAELAALPAEQRLLDYKHFSVYHARAARIPLLMQDIARERERVFRLYDEGSGQPRDGDDFDAAYAQLFVWDHQARSLVGAYRMGHADELRAAGGGTYLARMFEFAPAFYAGPPMLELGRSFVVPEHQKNYSALYLLWQGIGRYLAAHPAYPACTAPFPCLGNTTAAPSPSCARP